MNLILSIPIIYFDFAALAIFILMILFVFLRRLNRTSSSKVFLLLMMVSMLAAVVEICACQVQKYYYDLNIVSFDTDKHLLLSSLFAMDYLLRYTITFTYLIYMLIYTKSMLYIVKRKIFYVIFLVPYVLCSIMMILSAFFPIVFKLDTTGSEVILTETFVIYILMTMEMYYGLIIILHLVKNYKTFKKSQFISLILIIPAIVIGTILRYIYKDLYIDLLFIGLGALTIVQTVESPDLLLDSRTGLSSNKQFNLLMKRRYIYNTETNVILLNIINYSDILHKLGYENFDAYLKHFSGLLNNKYKSKMSTYTAYYLGDGLFGIIFYDVIGIRDLCDQMYNDLTNVIFKNIDFKATIGLCLINSGKDFNNYNSFIEFVDNFHDNILSGVTIYSDIKNDRDFLIKYNMESILDDAIKYNRFKVYYQPIYNVETKAFSGAEALSRIDDPTYGIIYPGSFIYYAETNGYISTIDLNVIENVMKFLKSINLEEYKLNQVSINLSLADFNTIDFVDKVLDLKKKYNFDPSLVLFEITETNTIGDKNYYFDKIDELKSNGFDFILDDYGVGYSNLERFAKSPIDFVKIDRELVKLSNNKMMKDILNTTFNMIHELDRKSVIEGIETREELSEFLKYNCNYVQGFFFSKPIPEDEFLAFLKENNIEKEEENK